MQRSSTKSVSIAIAFVVALWIALAGAFFGRNALFDMWRLRGYTAPAAVVQLADDTTMNDSARRLFYVYHPSIEAGANFNTHCRDSEYTIVLGCYVTYQGIYIFNINDARLQGVQQVTAAHELLHAAYDRLSTKDRERIDQLTQEAYLNLQDDRVKETIKQYQDQDPSSVPNELHSIIGTEVRDLPDELEEYYKRYFTDRSKIVAYSERYEAAFSSRKAQIDTLEKELEALKTRIDAANSDLESKQQYLQNNGPSIRQRAQNGSASQAEVDDFNAEVSAYNAEIASTNNLVRTYNNKRQQYIELVGEQNDLFKKIDSRESMTAQ